MKKEVIELQFGCSATCVVILDEHYKELGPTVFMDGQQSDVNLYGCSYKNPFFKKQLEEMASNYDKVYFVIRHIEKLTEEEQKRYISLVKDREFCGYFIPSNVLLVFTIDQPSDVSKITQELYHFCVVAIGK